MEYLSQFKNHIKGYEDTVYVHDKDVKDGKIDMGKVYWSWVRELHCVGCKTLTTFPRELGNVEKLYVVGCDALESLPDNMSKLRKLYLESNANLSDIDCGSRVLEEATCRKCPKVDLQEVAEMNKDGKENRANRRALERDIASLRKEGMYIA